MMALRLIAGGCIVSGLLAIFIWHPMYYVIGVVILMGLFLPRAFMKGNQY